jgi:hypothetical protein
MFRFFVNLFRVPKRSRSETRAFVRHLVAHYSQGNINLKAGRFITQEDADVLKRSVLAHKF